MTTVKRTKTVSFHKLDLLSQQKLVFLAKTDVNVRNRIISDTLALAVHIATTQKYRLQPVCVEDLVQEGVLGIIRALEMYDPQRHCVFSTYAYPWIMKYMDLLVSEMATSIAQPHILWTQYVTSNRKKLSKMSTIIKYTKEEEYELIRKAKEGDLTARNELIRNNYRLVTTIAAKHKYKSNGLAFEDLYQEGILGVIHAIETFDFSRNCRFSTHIHPWITKYMQVAIEYQSDVIPKPTSEWNKNGLILKAKNQLMQELKREPTIAEIAESLNLEEVRAVESVLESFQKSKSLNYKPADSDSEAEDFIQSEMEEFDSYKEEHASVILDDESSKFWSGVKSIVKSLTVVERAIIEYRYGIGREEKSVKDLAKILGIKEREVLQFETVALEKIRNEPLINNYFIEMVKEKQLRLTEK